MHPPGRGADRSRRILLMIRLRMRRPVESEGSAFNGAVLGLVVE